MSCRRRTACRLCESEQLVCVVELTPTPPGNHFRREDELGMPQESYPLELYFCEACHHVQLGHVVDPTILYQQDYSYVSGTSPVFVAHLEDYAAHVVALLDLQDGSLVADIGSNDGTCLRFFQRAGHRVLGVDPAVNIAERASADGVPTIGDFFTPTLAQRMRAEHGAAQLVTSHNACAHIDDLVGVMRGVVEWLAPDGFFVMEVGYFLDVYENAWFDTIYHEHLDYHTVGPLLGFFEQQGLDVFRVERVAPQGGSIRVFTQMLGGARERDDTVAALVELERSGGLEQADALRAFSSRINAVRDELGALVRRLKASGATIAGYGAPTKATTLLSHFELGDVLDFIVDDNPLKQGLYSPKHHIPVFAADAIYLRRPDFLLILAWNFADSIMARHARFAEEGGKFILPMPTARVVD